MTAVGAALAMLHKAVKNPPGFPIGSARLLMDLFGGGPDVLALVDAPAGGV